MVYFFHFSRFFWMKIHPKLNKFRIKELDWYIVSDFRFLLEIQAILPKTSLFLPAQMAVLYSFFQMFIVLGMYNFQLVQTQTKNWHRSKILCIRTDPDATGNRATFHFSQSCTFFFDHCFQCRYVNYKKKSKIFYVFFFAICFLQRLGIRWS